MANSVLNLLAGMSVGFYLTYNVDDETHAVFRKEVYQPVKQEMKKEDDPDYWTRIYNATKKGSMNSFDYLCKKYKLNEKKTNTK